MAYNVAQFGVHCDEDEPEKSARHLFIEDAIIAEEQSDGTWNVINGAWDGHIDKNGDFICDFNGNNCGKGTIITGEEWDNAKSEVDYHDYGFSRAKNALSKLSLKNVLQRETDNWLGGVLN